MGRLRPSVRGRLGRKRRRICDHDGYHGGQEPSSEAGRDDVGHLRDDRGRGGAAHSSLHAAEAGGCRNPCAAKGAPGERRAVEEAVEADPGGALSVSPRTRRTNRSALRIGQPHGCMRTRTGRGDPGHRLLFCAGASGGQARARRASRRFLQDDGGLGARVQGGVAGKRRALALHHRKSGAPARRKRADARLRRRLHGAAGEGGRGQKTGGPDRLHVELYSRYHFLQKYRRGLPRVQPASRGDDG